MRRRRVSALGALGRGLIAGALGSLVQDFFFRATSRIAPRTPQVFTPPDAVRASDTALEIMARRIFTPIKQHPLSDEELGRYGKLLHYGVGARWGAMWGLYRESIGVWRGSRGAAISRGLAPVATAASIFGFGSVVWMLTDNLMLPLFGLAAWPQKYPPKTHAYAFAAHLAYGAATVGSYEAMRPRPIAAIGAAVATMLSGRRLRARMPRVLYPYVNRALLARGLFDFTRRDLVRRGTGAIDALRS